ncbi:hypothetical protein METP3_00114 [Methanosarcinales archaeon]|nr:hypothetical protein METP3_00114 [Methanosarcinales archaeon]
MIKEAIFSVHDIIFFKIVAQQDYQKTFNKILFQYNTFYLKEQTKKIDSLDFTVYLGSFSPSNENCYIIDDKYHIKDNYFYCKDSRKLSTWKLEMVGFNSGIIRVNLQTNRFGKISVPLNMIDFLIHYVVNEKGSSIIHSSGVSNNNNNVMLFSARGGGGKTSIAAHFIDKGFKFLGDNFIILRNGHALSFISPFNIFTYNVTPLVKRNLGYKKKFILFLVGTIYKLTLSYIKIFVKLDIGNIMKDSTEKNGMIKSIFFIIPNNSLDSPEIENICFDDLIEHLVLNQKLEFLHLPFLNYILAISYVYPEINFSKHWDKYKNNLKVNITKNIKTYRINMPKKINNNIIYYLQSEISKLDGENERN